jgi:hypothetical protein
MFFSSELFGMQKKLGGKKSEQKILFSAETFSTGDTLIKHVQSATDEKL